MSKFYFSILFLLMMAQISVAQITFSYDGGGNRILRKTSGALPVTLISFNASKNPEGFTALLDWQTASEINSDRFDIERSQDGKKWAIIGTVKANGGKTSTSDYSFTDIAPLDGENLYRLKMIDSAAGTPEPDHKDGPFSFSRIQSVYFDSQISFYPNPVKDLLKIKGVSSGALIRGTIQLFNTSGTQVLSLSNIPADGIDMIALPTGVYMVKISMKDGASTISKVVKE